MSNFSQSERMALAKRGHAMSGGEFPIRNEQDLHNAIRDVGRAKDPAAAKAFIIRRARAMQLKSALPLSWL